MFRNIFTLSLACCLLQTASGQVQDKRHFAPHQRYPRHANIPNDDNYIVMQISGIVLEVAGITTVATTTRLQADEAWKHFLSSERPPDRTDGYVAGATMLMVGVTLNVLANAKLYPKSMRVSGNGVSFSLPKTNKHFGI